MENTNLTIENLRSNSLFKYISDNDLLKISKTMKEESFSAGTIIFNENTRGERLYLILDGKVKISKITRSGMETPLAILGKGEFFGEMEMIEDQARSARTTALEDTLVAGITNQDFDSLIKTNHIVTLNLLKAISKRLRSTDEIIVSELEKSLEVSKTQVDKLNMLIDAAKTVNSTLDLDKLLDVILETAIKSIAADRGTLYLVDELKSEIWSKALRGSEVVEIRQPIGKGLSGYVAKTGETINIPDAYNDSRFNADFDKKSGFRTNNVLCMPMRNRDGKIIGVFQMLNKKGGRFHDSGRRIHQCPLHPRFYCHRERTARTGDDQQ